MGAHCRTVITAGTEVLSFLLRYGDFGRGISDPIGRLTMFSRYWDNLGGCFTMKLIADIVGYGMAVDRLKTNILKCGLLELRR